MSATELAWAGIASVLTLLVAWVGMPIAYSLGHRLGMITQPRLFGEADRAISYLGGSALASAVVVVGFASLFALDVLEREVGALILAATVLLLLGTLDDRRRGHGVPPWLRLVVETLLGAGVWAAGVRATPTGIAVADAALTIFFLVAVTNAFNLLDNMDGIAGASAATIAAGLFALAAISGQYLVAILAASVFGACIAFLRHNLVGATLYLGNGGALFLGFLLAATTLKLRLPIEQPWSYVAAMAVLAVPATDTGLVIVSRTLARRPLFQGGIDHLSHRLVALGLSERGSVIAHALGSGLGAGAVAFVAATDRNESLALVVVLYMALGLLLLQVRVYEVEAPRRDELLEPGVALDLE